MIAADGGIEPAWDLAIKSVPALRDLLDAMPVIRDPSAREALYPRVLPLLNGLPDGLKLSGNATKGTVGRYVRISLKGRRTLTLAEVEVISDGRNIAPMGRASQKNVSSGGKASRGIDGNRSGSYGKGGQTHTEEETLDPWWEVDLGGEYPIESIAIYNRTDAELGERLEHFSVAVLDNQRGEGLAKNRPAGPRTKCRNQIGWVGVRGDHPPLGHERLDLCSRS